MFVKKILISFVALALNGAFALENENKCVTQAGNLAGDSMEDYANFSWTWTYYEFEVDMVPVSTQVCVVLEPEFRLKGFRIKMANASKAIKSPYIGLRPGPEVPSVICKEYDIPSNLY